MKKINYLDKFMFPDIPLQQYPVYAISESGKIINIKSILYPTVKSRKKFTRRKQLVFRSLQEKMFDTLINVGYFDPLPVLREFPIIIQNSLRLKDQDGLWYLLDYYFPTMCVAVELDSELHNKNKDEIRDKYLKDNLGITTFRINGFDKEIIQKTRFHELTKLLRGIKPLSSSKIFDFQIDIKQKPL